ncbi:hypothetical protein [Arthrobacter alpinus]|nr:hypothetical protein [Arthrobacter alpinus]
MGPLSRAMAAIAADPRFAARAAELASQLNSLSAPEEIVRLLEDLVGAQA